MGRQKYSPLLEKALGIVEMLVWTAVVAQVLNTITVETKGISAVPTQDFLISLKKTVKNLLGHLAS